MNSSKPRFIIAGLIASTLGLVALSAQASDTFDEKNAELFIPSVIVGTNTYKNVVIKVGNILSVGSSETTFPSDIYNSAKKQLSISAVTAYGRRYFNVAITVAEILSPGTSSINSFTGAVLCNIDHSGSQSLAYRHNLAVVNETLPYSYKWTCDSANNSRLLSANGVPNGTS
jgi:hypothetical protein